jgi:hypothetical protein
MESSQWENWNHLFCRKVSFLTDTHCWFRCVGQDMKQTYLYLWYPLSQAQWISSTCSSFWLTTYLLSLVDVFFNRQSSWHTHGYKLWSSSRRLVPLFEWGRLHTRASHEKRKEAIPILQFLGTTNSGISYQLKDIYAICRCCWNVATYKWNVHNGKIEIICWLGYFVSF